MAGRIGASQPPESERRKVLASFARWLHLLQSRTIALDEFDCNFTIALVPTDRRYWDDCLHMLPRDTLSSLVDFLRAFLVNVDFKPCPRPFLVAPFDDDSVNAKQEEMRPRYIALLKRATDQST